MSDSPLLIGWDVSTSAIGICIRQEGKPDKYSVIFPRGKDHLEKFRSGVEQVRLFMAKLGPWPPITHVVEERLGGFSKGRTSKQTLMLLAAMNAVISLELSYSGKVIYLHPGTTKRITGLDKLSLEGEEKKQTVVRLARMSAGFPYQETKQGNWVKGTDDMADAWLLVEAWSKVERGEAIGPAKKATKRKKSAGGTKDIRQKKG